MMTKLEVQIKSGKLSLREKKIYSFIENHPGSQSSEIAEKLSIPLPTVKRILTDMVKNKMLAMHGAGAGTNYSIEGTATIKKDTAAFYRYRKEKRNYIGQSGIIHRN